MLYLVASGIISLFLTFRSMDVMRYISIMAVYILNILSINRACHYTVNRASGNLTLKELIIAPGIFTVLSFLEFLRLGDRFKTLFSHVKDESGINTSRTSSLIVGSLLGIGLVFIFSLLLTQSDPIFKNYFTQFFNFLPDLNLSISADLVISIVKIVVFSGVFSAFLFIDPKDYEEFSSIKSLSKYGLEVAIATGAVAVLFAFYLIVQAQQLFAGVELLNSLNITYSEYTRRGFAELIIISSISLFLVWVLSGRKNESGYKFLSYIFIAEIILLLASALRRVYLYQDVFGFTQARIFGIAFCIWLGVTLGIFWARVSGKVREERIIPNVFLNIAGLVLLLNLLNVDYLSGVVKNPNLGHKTDYGYVAELSSDAWKGWEGVIEYSETKEGCDPWEANILKNKLEYLQSVRGKSWHNLGSWTVPDSQALKYLENNSERLNQLVKRFQECVGNPPTQNVPM